MVAEEVRKLAEQSKKSAIEIESMVQEIQSASRHAVKAIKDGGDKVEEGISKTSESLVVFTDIEEAVGDVGFKVESVSEVSLEVQRLAAVAADGANDTSAANEEITSSAQVLSDMAETLQNNVSHFRI